jgi:hypothetical protein
VPKAKIALAMPRSLLYRFQCRKKSLGNHLKVWRKKMFSLKSMTKLEALTVLYGGGGGTFMKIHVVDNRSTHSC